MTRIALGVEYAGDAFLGWQSQAHGRTVQDVLEAALGQVAGETLRLHCAGRTDAGVHASVQVVRFDTDTQRPLSAWVRGANALLPAAVVRWAVEVDEHFHARYLAYERRYRYLLFNSPTRPALLAGRVGWYHVPLDETIDPSIRAVCTSCSWKSTPPRSSLVPSVIVVALDGDVVPG